ncbi:DUF4279 domain-containing protein [Acrocarpospora catenulata]|uniref:DUF4279 domain-containing protein n=1 Tax=Acrocarpospora catenulata TaxID=2836182 RepID=UPI002023A806|nr:DUF4279 domain-containing protein [Acrocarpospora catenulata]
MFRVYLRLVSDSGDPDSVTRAVGRTPDEVWRVGETSPRSGRPRKFSSWKVCFGPKNIVGSPDGALNELMSWGLPTARVIRELATEGGWEASLVVVQEFRDPDNVFEKGIVLEAELIEWLAVAGAAVDIDQYIYYE